MPQQAQSDPWTEAAKNYKPSPSSGGTSAATGGNEDWKVWETGAAPAGNSIQQSFDANTADNPADSKLKTLVKGAVHGAGAPFIHPMDTAVGALKDLAIPARGVSLEDIQNSIPQEGQAGHALARIGGEALGTAGVGAAASGAGSAILDTLPSRARAGAALQDIRNAAQDVPVDMTRTQDPLNEAMRLSKDIGNSSPGKAVNKLAQRLEPTPLKGTDMMLNPEPINFPEARDRYSAIGNQSVWSKMKTDPAMGRQRSLIQQAMRQDLVDAADKIGRGQDLDAAMKEYANASRLKDFGANALKYGVPAVVGTGITGKVLKDLAK